MRYILDRFEGWQLLILVICLGSTITGIVAAWRAPHEYVACQQMAHGNIQAYNECVRAEHGNR